MEELAVLRAPLNWEAQLNFARVQLSALVVESQPAVLKVQGSNPGWEAQDFSKLTFISRNSAV